MPVPKKQRSKARCRTRRAVLGKIEAPNIIDCPQCAEPVLPHQVCPKCGYYRGRQVFEPKQKAKS